MKVYNTSSVYRCTCNTTWIFSSYFLFLCIFSRTGFGSALAGPCCSLCPLLSHQSNCPNTTGEWTNARDTEGTCIKHCAFKSRVNLDSLSFLFVVSFQCINPIILFSVILTMRMMTGIHYFTNPHFRYQF